MNVLDLNYLTAIPLLIAIVAALTTLLRVLSALADRQELMRARMQGRYMDAVALAVVDHAIRRELVRMAKHVVIISVVVLSFTPWLSIGARNVAFAMISIGMMSNSLFDRAVQNFAMANRAPELPSTSKAFSR